MRTSLVQRTSVDWDRVIYESRVPHRLSLFIPLLALRTGLELVPALPAELEGFFTRLIAATMILVVALVIDAALTAAHALYLRLPNAGLRPITSYIQLAKVFVYVAGIFTIARIADQSPWFFVSGLGALMAIIGDHRCLPNHLHGPRSGKT